MAGQPVFVGRWVSLSAVMTGLSVIASPAAVADEPPWTSKAGHFRVSYKSELDPLTINEIHRWVFHVETSDGEAVTSATLSIEGGMPVHDHGLPTSPRQTRNLGDGDYLIEGMRFHMNGLWELSITIETARYRDEVVIPLEL